MPRLLLVNPSQQRDNLLFPPLSLSSLAAHTPRGWSVRAADENLARLDPARVEADVVAMTAFTMQATRAFDLASALRARGIPVVLGGIHASVLPDACLRHVDSVIVGEGERIWPDVLSDAAAGRLRRRYDGIAEEDLGALKAPDRSYIADKYSFASLEATRGCPFACDFCSIGPARKGRFRHRPVAAVADELARIRQKIVCFVDDNFAGHTDQHRAYAADLCREIIRRDIRKAWFVLSSAQLALRGDLALLRRAGCRGVLVGFENLGPQGNRELNKPWMDRCDAGEVVRELAGAGLAVWGSFLLGQDHHDAAYLERLERFVLEEPLHFLSLHRLTALPGTGVYDRAKAEGRLVYADEREHWDHCDYTHHTIRYRGMTPHELDRRIDEILRRFYAPRRAGRRLRGLMAARPDALQAALFLYGTAKERAECRAERRAHAAAAQAGVVNMRAMSGRARRRPLWLGTL